MYLINCDLFPMYDYSQFLFVSFSSCLLLIHCLGTSSWGGRDECGRVDASHLICHVIRGTTYIRFLVLLFINTYNFDNITYYRIFFDNIINLIYYIYLMLYSFSLMLNNTLFDLFFIFILSFARSYKQVILPWCVLL